MTPCRLQINTEYSDETAACIIRRLLGRSCFIHIQSGPRSIEYPEDRGSKLIWNVGAYTYKYTRHHIPEDYKFCQIASRGTKHWISGAQKITHLPLFDIPGSKCSGTTIFINIRVLNFAPFLHDACSRNIPKVKCAISFCNGGATVSVSTLYAVTPPCASLSCPCPQNGVVGLPTGSSAQRISQLCFCVCYQGVSKWQQLTMPAGSRGSLGKERAWGVKTIWKQLFPKWQPSRDGIKNFKITQQSHG
jgi:hypothetical protein